MTIKRIYESVFNLFKYGLFNLISMPVTKPIIEIVNVVASATIDQKLDLYDIQKKFPGVEYNPDQFPGAVFRLKIQKLQHYFLVPAKWYALVPNQKIWQKRQ